MSFVNLMASDVWSDADITRRTEAMLRTEFSLEAETILNRKALGMVLGSYTPTPAELAEMGRYTALAQAAHDEGVAARADMELLLRVLAIEEAQRRLERPIPEETSSTDLEERSAAQDVIDAADDAALELVAARRAQVVPH